MKLKLNSLSRGVCAGCIVGALSLLYFGCGGDGESTDKGANQRPEDTGAACESADECFAGVAEGDLQGEAMCLDRVRDGYCTHTCEEDTDCCAAEGECKTDLSQVCSPFESTGMKMCFLSCEDSDIEAADAEDEDEYCQREASPDFICRSSGGGAENRKVCVPGNCGFGARCLGDDDCSGDLECLTSFAGGYCSKTGCTSDADCESGAGEGVCVDPGNGGDTYCAKSCARASDCSFCRGDQLAATCRDDVAYVEDGTSGGVCIPG